ncbi:MAG: nucleotidyltransferase [Oscillospiraceae bacterium]|nr:nucleotidyltransferase [Oscillospiraceae bacterium]
MQEPTLVIMAAGMGSRFGGLKQMTPIDEQGHFIMDYSIFDAIRAGFGKVVCVIKEEMRDQFEALIGRRVRGHVELAYAYQSLDRIPEGCSIPDGRVKPWGTAHAVLCAADEIDGPFAVINADDFYGYEAFRAMADFLKADRPASQQAMVGYALENTLTENGSVSRGVCEVNNEGLLTAITERTTIEKRPDGAAYTEDGGTTYTHLDGDTVVSMNLWGFQRPVLDRMEQMFRRFLTDAVPANPMKAEFYLPLLPDALIADGSGTVQVLTSDARWYGVTYREDLPGVVAAIAAMKAAGQYPDHLWK